MKSILIVEDEDKLREVLFEFLSSFYNVVAVSSFSEAKTALEKKEFDILITDNDFAEEINGGIRLLELCRKMYPHIIKVLMTGRFKKKTEEENIKNICDIFLRKPFTPDSLYEKIEKYLRRNV